MKGKIVVKRFKELTIDNERKLMFGRAVHPVVTRRGLSIGGGTVYPELNFTVPPMEITEATIGGVSKMYGEMIDDACKRAYELDSEGFVVEFETLLEMTIRPAFAIELTKVLNDVLEKYYQKRGLKTTLRITVNDTREMIRPPLMRSGEMLEAMIRTFEGCAREGAELLSIESTGGKEIHDDALLNCDIARCVFSLAIMGCRDMNFLWEKIVGIARATGTIPAGDTACGFGNTAMVLADRKYIPRVFAAVIRAVTAVRSLVAYEQGAVGPGKDCGYENPVIKAITGVPISMEGKSAACAHLSPLGNISAAACDLWSNESVQIVKLLGGLTPTISLEQLIYDCRLMNKALALGDEVLLQRLMVQSDVGHDPQALVLAPVSVLRIARAIVREESYYHSAVGAAKEAIAIIREGHQTGQTKLPEVEIKWLDRIEETVETFPSSEEKFIDEIFSSLDGSKFIKKDYGF